ncbi:hypothetical protein LTR40_006832, partial [Exophiala xenobiotica]
QQPPHPKDESSTTLPEGPSSGKQRTRQHKRKNHHRTQRTMQATCRAKAMSQGVPQRRKLSASPSRSSGCRQTDSPFIELEVSGTLGTPIARSRSHGMAPRSNHPLAEGWSACSTVLRWPRQVPMLPDNNLFLQGLLWAVSCPHMLLLQVACMDDLT